VIEIRNLTKRFGMRTAVDDLSFTVPNGVVTGFLGPNGAGKSTTMRVILGLDRPTSGGATIDGRSYADLPAPLREVGALLDAKAVHPGRKAYVHLQALAQSNGISRKRVDTVLDIVGLTDVAKERAGSFSLGMSQRLGIAAALLGDPPVLLFDEPVNGLDPEGILWIRNLMHALAREGRTVFVSSHLMSEMALTAQHLVVIGRGKLIADDSVDEFIRRSSRRAVRVRTPNPEPLVAQLRQQGATVTPDQSGALIITGMEAPAVGDAAFAAGVVLHELAAQEASLEEAFMEMTRDSVEFHAAVGNWGSEQGSFPQPASQPAGQSVGQSVGQAPAGPWGSPS
jgi:ABC-2 type transport system ATP-binding protein